MNINLKIIIIIVINNIDFKYKMSMYVNLNVHNNYIIDNQNNFEINYSYCFNSYYVIYLICYIIT